MKKILFIIGKNYSTNIAHRIHYEWVAECKDIFDIQFWGDKYVENVNLRSLQNKIDTFKPDYIYATHRKTIYEWLPDLTNIRVPKIFVEVDTYKYNRLDSWYKQFDVLLCREPFWEHEFSPMYDIIFFKEYVKRYHKYKNISFSKSSISQKAKKHYNNYVARMNKSKYWGNVPFFCWSVSEKDICKDNKDRTGIKFLARCSHVLYPVRNQIKKRFSKKIIMHTIWDKKIYLSEIQSASALICPTESLYGDFIPAKLFEYLASGAAVITNCDLKRYGVDELEPFVIKYKLLDDLQFKLDMDFSFYHNRAEGIMQNYTHKGMYGKIFS